MAIKSEGFYTDSGHETLRAARATKQLIGTINALFRKAKTPREAMELDRVIKGDISIACSIRILNLQYGIAKKNGKGK
jgi:hypothetical protein